MILDSTNYKYVIDNIDTLSWDKLANTLITVDGKSVTKCMLRRYCYTNNIKKSENNKYKKQKSHSLSDIEIKFLEDS